MAPTNSIADLAKGTVNTTKGRKEFTILVVGETGTGKTTVLTLLANLLKGNTPSNYETVINPSNEAGGGEQHSQTNAAFLYSFTSNNHVNFHILDTPGLADTKGAEYDKLHKESIAKAIKDKITVVDGVLILANGTLARLGPATDYALHTLSAMFPITLSKNIGFLFTNVSSALGLNFVDNSLPEALRENPMFFLDNPVAMQNKYIKEKEKMEAKGKVNETLLQAFRVSVEEGHTKALGVFVQIFNWLDTLSSQPTNDILSLYNKSQEIEMKITDALATMTQIATQQTALLKIEAAAGDTGMTIEHYKEYQYTISQDMWERVDQPHHSTLCVAPSCYKNCHSPCSLNFSVNPEKLRNCWAFDNGWPFGVRDCRECGHPYTNHQHYNATWVFKQNRETKINEEAKKKHDDAVSEKAQQEIGMQQLKGSLAKMDKALVESTGRVGDLVKEYATLSLSGSFTGQIRKSVALLEQHVNVMLEKGTDQKTIDSVTKALNQMKGKLALVEKLAGPGK